MKYLVRSYSAGLGAISEQTVEAPSADLARAALAADRGVVLSVQALARGQVGRGALDVAWWCRELRTLVSAGMTVVEALETLRAQPLGQERADVHQLLVEQLRQGLALSDAMRQVPTFPAVLIAGVKAGERTSSLVEALDDYLLYHEMLEQLRKKVVSAAIYPALVMALGSVITVFLLMYVMPRFAGMYADLAGAVSPATRLMMAVSALMRQHSPAVAGLFVGLMLALAWAWRSGAMGRWALALAERLAPLRRRINEFRLAKLYQCLALMFRGGYALDDALKQSEGLGLGERLRQGIVSARAGLQRGQRVCTAFTDAGLTDEVTQRLLAVGERTGNFDRVLQTIAERHAANFTTFIERATRVVEPVLLMLVALVVGGIVVMMYMPVFDIASSVR